MATPLIYFVVTADQVDSRRTSDRVPAALERLALLADDTDASRAFVRTAGDEIQGLLSDPRELIASLEALTQLGGWRVGIGVGPVLHPIADDVRAASGPAFFAAREAVQRARTAPQGLAAQTHGDELAVEVGDLSAALTLLHAAWARRSAAGWEVAALADEGLGTGQIAQRLNVTSSAVSQRLKAAMVEECRMGRVLAENLARRVQAGRS